jgi:SNF2 family DNA or RNA helicase
MRDYQKYGFNWLAKLAYNGLSGILADDMGLGKSLEIISLIEADPDDLPILILSPLSVVNNWKSEFEKWAPNIRVYIINGQSKYLMNSSISRKKTVFITSYEFLTYNLNFIKKFHFKYFIIDEAQYIKNKNTIRSESVKQVSSNIRFALTGTPIENHEDDLWNIFDFLYPKIFKFYNNKISNFKKREYIKPFILRRKKSEVLKELPLKTEVIVPLEMTMKQKEIYDYYNNLNLDFKDSALDIIVHLTRLRQICITPKLLDESIQSDSVKLNYLNEKILEITQLDESVLIFSSFTTTFKFIEEILNERNILFKKLTGEMNLSERQNAINEFNLNKNIKVFLISLKTGGVGLNLVKANNVIFVDPWWNIAAENQASDRVHRIGQSKNVMVYKLIVSNSIEEYVMSVQNNKLNIINYFIEVGTNKPLEKLDLKTLKDLLIKSQNN